MYQQLWRRQFTAIYMFENSFGIERCVSRNELKNLWNSIAIAIRPQLGNHSIHPLDLNCFEVSYV